MKITGLQELQQHVPELRTPVRAVLIGLMIFGMITITTTFFNFVNRYIPIWAPDGQIIITAIGFGLLYLFFKNKEKYKRNSGDLAYRKALFIHVLPGLSIIFSCVAYTAYIPGPNIPLSWWPVVTPYLGWYFVVAGAILWIRSIITFGLDNLAMLYVYFPEKGRHIDHQIYRVLRHPVYAGVLRIGIGLAFLNGNIFAIIFGLLILPIVVTGWVRLVEEKELINRFGSGYIAYRKKTPAFWPYPHRLGGYWKYLLLGS